MFVCVSVDESQNLCKDIHILGIVANYAMTMYFILLVKTSPHCHRYVYCTSFFFPIPFFLPVFIKHVVGGFTKTFIDCIA